MTETLLVHGNFPAAEVYPVRDPSWALALPVEIDTPARPDGSHVLGELSRHLPAGDPVDVRLLVRENAMDVHEGVPAPLDLDGLDLVRKPCRSALRASLSNATVERYGGGGGASTSQLGDTTVRGSEAPGALLWTMASERAGGFAGYATRRSPLSP
jgi:hypothetical protein